MPIDRTTPLYGEHVALGAKLVSFGGFVMPLHYGSILEEHRAVRERAGLFDVSHMGEIEVSGPQAVQLVEELVTNRVSALTVGQALYTPMCREDGTVIDDLLVYRLSPSSLVLVVNAANTARDLQWIGAQAERFPRARVRDISEATALLSVQGPRAAQIIRPLCDDDPHGLAPFTFRRTRVAGAQTLVSRTGYTGEDGFELYADAPAAASLWRAILEAGRAQGLEPVGLGARDTLRFEARLALYGQELDDTTNPLEAGLKPFVKLDKPGFVGREALLVVAERGPGRRLVGLELVEPGIARHGYPIFDGEQEVGVVTSGMLSPTLGRAMGLGYVPSDRTEPGRPIAVGIRGRRVQARIVRTPFYRRRPA